MSAEKPGPVDARSPLDTDRSRKVTALVLRDRDGATEFLLFEHPPRGTVINLRQVPAGTVEPGEAPEDAVVRELQEETGLRGRVERLVDVRDEVYLGNPTRRWVYAMRALEETPDRWDYRCDCGAPIVLQWVPVDPSQVSEAQQHWIALLQQ